MSRIGEEGMKVKDRLEQYQKDKEQGPSTSASAEGRIEYNELIGSLQKHVNPMGRLEIVTLIGWNRVRESIPQEKHEEFIALFRDEDKKAVEIALSGKQEEVSQTRPGHGRPGMW